MLNNALTNSPKNDTDRATKNEEVRRSVYEEAGGEEDISHTGSGRRGVRAVLSRVDSQTAGDEADRGRSRPERQGDFVKRAKSSGKTVRIIGKGAYAYRVVSPIVASKQAREARNTANRLGATDVVIFTGALEGNDGQNTHRASREAVTLGKTIVVIGNVSVTMKLQGMQCTRKGLCTQSMAVASMMPHTSCLTLDMCTTNSYIPRSVIAKTARLSTINHRLHFVKIEETELRLF